MAWNELYNTFMPPQIYTHGLCAKQAKEEPKPRMKRAWGSTQHPSNPQHDAYACLIMTLKVTIPFLLLPPHTSSSPVTSSCLAAPNAILFCTAMQALRITCFTAAQQDASTCSSPRPVAVNTFQLYPWINLRFILICFVLLCVSSLYHGVFNLVDRYRR